MRLLYKNSRQIYIYLHLSQQWQLIITQSYMKVQYKKQKVWDHKKLLAIQAIENSIHIIHSFFSLYQLLSQIIQAQLLLYQYDTNNIFMYIFLTVFAFFTRLVLSNFKKMLIEKLVFVPPHRYNIGLIQGLNYQFVLSWEDESDLDASIFKVGQTESMKTFQQSQGFFEMFSYSSEETGQYTVNINPYNIKNKVICYSLKIIGDTAENLFENCFFQNHLQNSAITVPLESKVGQIKYYAPQSIFIEYFCLNELGPFFPINNQSFQFLSQCFPQMILLLKQDLQSNLTFYTVKIEIEYDLLCLSENCNEERLFQVNGYLIGICTFVFGVIFVKAIYKIRKCLSRINRTQNEIQLEQIQRETINQLNIHNTLSEIEVSESSCAICLQENCEVRLNCRHQYHKLCISSWFMRKKHCPVCRKDFRNPKTR